MGLATNAQSVTRLFRGDVIEAEKHFASGEAALLHQGLRRSFVGTWTISLLGWNAWIMGRADEARERVAPSPRLRTMISPAPLSGWFPRIST